LIPEWAYDRLHARPEFWGFAAWRHSSREPSDRRHLDL